MRGILDDWNDKLVQKAVASNTLYHLLVCDSKFRLALKRTKDSVKVMRVNTRACAPESECVVEERRALGKLEPWFPG